MDILIITLVLVLIITGGFIAFQLMSRGSRNVPLLSHLVCPNCGGQFDYAWVPGMSVTAIRLGKVRLFSCPHCGKVSFFNIWETQVDPETHRCPTRIGPL